MSGFNPFDSRNFFSGGLGNSLPGSGIDTYIKRLRPYEDSQTHNLFLKEESSYGNKIYLPDKILDDLTKMQIEYPILFKVENVRTGEYTHAGVLQFTAEMGKTWLPPWMKQKLNVQNRDMVKITNVTLPKCTFAKLEPQSVDFLDITDTRAVLENAMSNYSTLTKGDIIPFKYAGKIYEIKVLELKPQDAVSIVETDMETDFAPPVGYVEPEKWEPSRIRKHYEQSVQTQSSSNSSTTGAETPRRGGVILDSKRRVRRTNALEPSTPRSSNSRTTNKKSQLQENTESDGSSQKTIAPFELPLGHLFFGYDIPPAPPSPTTSENKNTSTSAKGKERETSAATGGSSASGGGGNPSRPRRGVILGSSASRSQSSNPSRSLDFNPSF
ncbi:ubiquitin fusion degradation protein [Mycoemilia scoparia]|uniref:Ubiquitin fusion degradation protein n=1 Tax=Mycoemilia scoparia TaxID=417184 RepID=A0A9W7ZU81_9FUNG|nr:ubiquitin fusion degradation protein [Mycoemilia scoparia]